METERRDGPVEPWQPSEEGLANARRHLGRKLREQRRRAKLSQKAAAELAGVSQSVYGRLELGTAVIEAEPLARLCVAYGCKASDLMPAVGSYPSAPADPAERREFFRARNAAIRGRRLDEDG